MRFGEFEAIVVAVGGTIKERTTAIAMRETHRSLRIYLIVVAGFGLYVNIVNIRELGSCGRIGVLCFTDALIGILFAFRFLRAGLMYRVVLAASGKSIISLLRAKIVYNLLALAVVIAILAVRGWPPVYTPVLLLLAVGIAVPLYLLANVRRLARDMQPSSQPQKQTPAATP